MKEDSPLIKDIKSQREFLPAALDSLHLFVTKRILSSLIFSSIFFLFLIFNPGRTFFLFDIAAGIEDEEEEEDRRKDQGRENPLGNK